MTYKNDRGRTEAYNTLLSIDAQDMIQWTHTIGKTLSTYGQRVALQITRGWRNRSQIIKPPMEKSSFTVKRLAKRPNITVPPTTTCMSSILYHILGCRSKIEQSVSVRNCTSAQTERHQFK